MLEGALDRQIPCEVLHNDLGVKGNCGVCGLMISMDMFLPIIFCWVVRFFFFFNGVFHREAYGGLPLLLASSAKVAGSASSGMTHTALMPPEGEAWETP